jgi:hypothetical protein
MRIIIAGGRTFNDFLFLKTEVIKVFKQLKLEYPDTKKEDIEIISGCANGADKNGELFAEQYNFKVARFPAAWDDLNASPCLIKTNSYGKRYNSLAGRNRNLKMAEYAKQDNGILIAFWDGKSPGTKGMIDIARKLGLRIFEIRYIAS